ncbi:serine/threonine-protein kinase, partial [Mycolicibacillus trivialis]|uniref:serine/threonine-protein kinase n=2 Tax=Mycolicibacillus trivialis TaxID=1798 RepID=UPI0021F2BF88
TDQQIPHASSPEQSRKPYLNTSARTVHGSRLSHPNIVTLYDRGEFEGRLWISMEYVAGTDGAGLLAGAGPLDPEQMLALIGGAGAALDYAWRKHRITHRDVKPANILVGLDTTAAPPVIESVKLADFGIAKAAGESSTLTATGTTIGTLLYLSPEAIEGLPADNRADIYSLACTAFHLLTGEPPFLGSSMAATMAAHLSKPVPAISTVVPHLPPELDVVFSRALAKDRDDRYQTCADFVAALRASVGDTRGAVTITPTVLASSSAIAPDRDAVASGAATLLPSNRHRDHPAVSSGRERPRNRSTLVSVVAILGLVAAGLGNFALTRDRSDTAAAPAPSPATTAPVSATTTSPAHSTALPTTSPAAIPTPDSIVTATVTSAPAPESPAPPPVPASVNVNFRVEAETPHVEVAYAPGEWQQYTLPLSQLYGRYALSMQTTAGNADDLYVAVRGSFEQYCLIRVSAVVVVTNSGADQAECRASAADAATP